MNAVRLVIYSLLACLWCVSLLGLRLTWTGHTAFFFMAWNLFLALIPLGFSLALQRIRHGFLGLPLVGGWLLFFPNAPYVLTDLLHLRERDGLPLWFDLLMLLSFALVALWIGFQSLRLVQGWVVQRTSVAVSWAFVASSLMLSGFGIYLGRFLRWNSWDILSRPGALFHDILIRVANPLAHPYTWAFTTGFGGLLIIAYLFWTLANAAPARVPVRSND